MGSLVSDARALLAIAAGLCAGVAHCAAPLPSVTAKIGDPFSQCEAVATALPDSLKGLRRMGTVASLKVSDDVAEYCDPDRSKCRRAAIVLPGLKADLLEVAGNPTLAVLSVELSSSRWRLLKGGRIGQKLDDLLAFYGVEAPPNRGEFGICGDTVCLAVGTSQPPRVQAEAGLPGGLVGLA